MIAFLQGLALVTVVIALALLLILWEDHCVGWLSRDLQKMNERKHDPRNSH